MILSEETTGRIRKS